MGCIGKTVVRGVVITALAGGVLVAVAGPHRVGALVQQTRGNIVSVIDDNIDDPVLLRAQIKKLEAQYPGKIAEVRSDLSEVQTQIAQLDRELKIAAISKSSTLRSHRHASPKTPTPARSSASASTISRSTSMTHTQGVSRSSRTAICTHRVLRTSTPISGTSAIRNPSWQSSTSV